jgi:predicted NAD-dependent protein-ADP-ribosyltransferase YbiA (DUF1768 family)
MLCRDFIFAPSVDYYLNRQVRTTTSYRYGDRKNKELWRKTNAPSECRSLGREIVSKISAANN